MILFDASKCMATTNAENVQQLKKLQYNTISKSGFNTKQFKHMLMS